MFKKINLNTNQVLGIFILLVGFLLLSSKRMTQSILHTMIGRLFLVCCVIMFSHHSLILGIFSVLLILWLTQNSAKSFVIEGMADPTLSSGPTLSADQQTALDDKKKELQASKETKYIGVNKEAIQAMLQAKPSNELPVPSSSSSDDVTPNVKSLSGQYSFL